jgi:hypothetical protein
MAASKINNSLNFMKPSEVMKKINEDNMNKQTSGQSQNYSIKKNDTNKQIITANRVTNTIFRQNGDIATNRGPLIKNVGNQQKKKPIPPKVIMNCKSGPENKHNHIQIENMGKKDLLSVNDNKKLTNLVKRSLKCLETYSISNKMNEIEEYIESIKKIKFDDSVDCINRNKNLEKLYEILQFIYSLNMCFCLACQFG